MVRDKLWTKTGSLPFLAPEQLNDNAGYYEINVDEWGIGVIMYHMLTGELPFMSSDEYILLK